MRCFVAVSMRAIAGCSAYRGAVGRWVARGLTWLTLRAAEEKAEAEELLRAAISLHLDRLPVGRQVMLKVTIPTVDDFHREFLEHPKVL